MKKLVVLVSFLLLSLHAFAQSAANDIKEITAMILTQQKQTNETMVDARVFSSQGYYSFYSTGGLLNFNPNPAVQSFDGVNLEAKLSIYLVFSLLQI